MNLPPLNQKAEPIAGTPVTRILILIKQKFKMDLDRSEETLRLMQLCSPMLPTGAFAYSQGLEFAVSSGWIKDHETTKVWINGLCKNVEIPTKDGISASEFLYIGSSPGFPKVSLLAT